MVMNSSGTNPGTNITESICVMLSMLNNYNLVISTHVERESLWMLGYKYAM